MTTIFMHVKHLFPMMSAFWFMNELVAMDGAL